MLSPGGSVFDIGIVEDPEILRPRVIARKMSAASLSGFLSKLCATYPMILKMVSIRLKYYQILFLISS